MEDSLHSQFEIMAIFIITGLIIGALFDSFRAQRKALKIPDFVTYIQDVLFWILSGVILITTIVTFTDGQIRSYMVIGMIVGILGYFSLISRFVVKIETNLITGILNIVNLFVYPFKKIYKFVKKRLEKHA